MYIRTVIALLAAGVLLVGCSKEEKPADTSSGSLGDSLKNAANDTGDAAKKAAEDAADAAKAKAEEAKEAAAGQFEELKAKAVATAEDQLTLAESKLTELQTRLDSAAAPIKAAAQPLYDTAKAKLAAVGPKVDALKAAGAETWEAAATELTGTIEELKKAVADLASKLGG